MPDTYSPLDLLAEELGAIAARIERDLRLQMATLVAEAREEMAALRAARIETELTVVKSEQQREFGYKIKLATLDNLPPGRPGDPGPEGPQGPPGMLPLVAAWADGVHYAGAVVTHGGRTWQATRDTGREPPHEDWICVAERGVDGADGRGFVMRRTWAEDVEYAALDVVMIGGSSFVALIDSPGKCPGENWQLLAGAGSRGKQGEIGPRGERGPAGRSIVSATVNADGLLTLTADDGTSLSCDFYPLLSRATR